MRLCDCKKGDAIQLPDGRAAIVRWPLSHPERGPQHTVVGTPLGTKYLSPNMIVTPLVPAPQLANPPEKEATP